MRKKYTIAVLCALLFVTALLCCACGNDGSGSDGNKVITVKFEGVSMEPTLKDGQVVDILALNGAPQTGDIILIERLDGYKKPLIKRVIASAGQELKIDFDKNEVYVDGKLLKEEYIQGQTVRGDIPDEEINDVIPEGKVFVMGDNRSVSLDSRYSQIGLIDIKKNVSGIVAEPET